MSDRRKFIFKEIEKVGQVVAEEYMKENMILEGVINVKITENPTNTYNLEVTVTGSSCYNGFAIDVNVTLRNIVKLEPCSCGRC